MPFSANQNGRITTPPKLFCGLLRRSQICFSSSQHGDVDDDDNDDDDDVGDNDGDNDDNTSAAPSVL